MFIGIPREQMKGEGFLRIPFLKKPIMIKVLSYGTKVPCAGHFCALPEAIIQKGKVRTHYLKF